MTSHDSPSVTLYRKHSTGTWYANVYWSATKTRKRLSLSVTTEAEAKAAFAEFKLHLLPSIIADHVATPHEKVSTAKPSSPRIRDICDWFVDTHMPDQGLKPRSQAKYAQVLRDFELWCRGANIGRIDQLNYSKVTEFLDWMSKDARPGGRGGTKSPKTRNDVKGILRRLLLAAVDTGKLTETPIRKWFIKKGRPATDTFALTATQLAEVLDTISREAPHISNITRFIAETGVRPSDALDLRWSQVNFEKRFVRRSQVKTDNLATYSLSDGCLAALKAEKERGKQGPKGEVFTNTEGRPLSYNALYRTFTRALDRVGYHVTVDGEDHVPDLKTLRHTCGTILAHLGCPPFLLQRQLGHERIETTLQYYHADPEQGLVWAEKFHAAVAGACIETTENPGAPYGPKRKRMPVKPKKT